MAERIDWIGQRFDDYRLVRFLGDGTFGDVYYAEQVHQQTPAAVKVFKTKLTPDKFKQFINEVRTVLLKHPNIVPIIDFGVREEDELGYLVMEYAPNGTLLVRHPRGTRLPLSAIVTYVNQLAAALQYAHNHRRVHRDVKPGNVLFGAKNELLLSDFGLAVVAHNPTSQRTEERSGTAAYMAPEQWRGKPFPASDQYALAIMVYEWLCGERPFQGDTLQLQYQHTMIPAPSLHEKDQTIPPEVEQVVLTALAKNPKDRWASVQAFATALQAAVGVPPIDSRSASTSDVSVTGTAPPAMASPVHESRPTIETNWLTVAPEPPPAIPANLDVPAPVPPPGKQAPATVPFPEAAASTPAPLWAERPAPVPPIPTDGRAAAQAPLPVALRKKPLPPFPFTLGSLPSRVRPPGGRAIILALLVLLMVSGGGIGGVLYLRAHHPLPSSMAGPSAYDQFVMKNGIQFGFDAQRSGFNPYESQLSPATVATLVQAWTATTGDVIDSSPAVANGVVYVGSGDSKLYAFQANGCGQSTCSPLWTASTGDWIDSSPAVANGVVYVGSVDQTLYAFRADGCGQPTCQPLWTATTGGEVFSPAVANGVVYMGSRDAKLYAFKADGCGQSTCSPLWTASTGGGVYSPAVANGVVYVGSVDQKLYAFRANGCGQPTCRPLWTASTGGVIFSSPAVANGVVYVGSLDSKLYAFQANGCGQSMCSPLWTASTGAAIESSPAVANGVVYAGSEDHKLYAFQANGCGQSTCSPLWTASTGVISSPPAVANGVVYVGSGDSKLYAFHRR